MFGCSNEHWHLRVWFLFLLLIFFYWFFCLSCWRPPRMRTGTWGTSPTRWPTGAGRSPASPTRRATTRHWWATRPLPSGWWTRRCTTTCPWCPAPHWSLTAASPSTRCYGSSPLAWVERATWISWVGVLHLLLLRTPPAPQKEASDV